MTREESILLGAVIGGLFGLFSALIGGRFAHLTAERKRKDDLRTSEQARADQLFATALDFLSGRTQRRNLGIATMELCCQVFPRYKQLCTDMLVGSAIYLLTGSEQQNKAAEIFNLRRIMDCLIEMLPGVPQVRNYSRLKKEIEDRNANYVAQPKKGLWVDQTELQQWQRKLQGVP